MLGGWRNLLLIYPAVTGVLLACAFSTKAQSLSTGYYFVEAADEGHKPLVSAAVIAYNQSGGEVLSGVTDKNGKASILKRTGQTGHELLIFRVLKPGYKTYEETRMTSDRWWASEEISVKLVSAFPPKEKSKAAAAKELRPKPKSPALVSYLRPVVVGYLSVRGPGP